jgi:hypothetical protein
MFAFKFAMIHSEPAITRATDEQTERQRVKQCTGDASEYSR